MDLGFLLGLSAITLAVIGLLVYLGRKLSRFIQKRAPDSDLAIGISSTGSLLFALTVGFWVVCLVERELHPDSSFGMFLQGTDRMLAVVVWSVVCCIAAGLVLTLLGYPIVKKTEPKPVH